MARIEPRKREVLVVLGLLLTLFYLRQSGFFSSNTTSDVLYDDIPEKDQVPLAPVEEALEHTSKAPAIEPYYAPKYKVAWQDAAMPETSLVSHVWGGFSPSFAIHFRS